MKQIITEYGTAIMAMICITLIIGLAVTLLFSSDSPLGINLVNFANQLGGGAN